MMASGRHGAKVHEYFGDEPPGEEKGEELKGSLFWPAIRIIAILATAIYLIVFVFLPIFSNILPYFTTQPRLLTNICTSLVTYVCADPKLSNGTITFSLMQSTGRPFTNVTVYAVPTGSNFSLETRSQFPSSQHIDLFVSGQRLSITLTDGSSRYAPPRIGTYEANIWIIYSSVQQGLQVERIGALTVTS